MRSQVQADIQEEEAAAAAELAASRAKARDLEQQVQLRSAWAPSRFARVLM